VSDDDAPSPRDNWLEYFNTETEVAFAALERSALAVIHAVHDLRRLERELWDEFVNP
jgi:hypothetical protein